MTTANARPREWPVIVGAAAVCLALCVPVLGLDQMDWSVPFCTAGDAQWMLAFAQMTLEDGWPLTAARLGAPFGLEMYDHPVPDNLHFAALKVLGWLGCSAAGAYNLYYLLTYPLTAAAAAWALREAGVSRGSAAACALLYAFLPYHHQRLEGGHYFLAAYYLVPPLAVLSLWLFRGRTPFLRRDDSGRPRLDVLSRDSLTTLGVCVLAGGGGVYYAFFGCFFLSAAGVLAAARRDLTAALSAALVVAVLAGCLGLNLLPQVWQGRERGWAADSVTRLRGEGELHGLKVAQLVLPSQGHRDPTMRQVREFYDRDPVRPCQTENASSSLGLVGSVGFVTLCLTAFGLVGGAAGARLRPAALLNLAALLLAGVGGFGSVFNLFVSANIRGYNRISIFIAFLALVAVGLLLDALGRRLPAWLGGLALVGLVALGVWDQTTRHGVQLPEARDAWRRDGEFVVHLERQLPAGSAVFQLPYLQFPEHQPVGHAGPYDHFKGYLHSEKLRWSYGAMKGRRGDAWARATAHAAGPELVRRLALAGYAAVWLDRRATADDGREFAGRLESELGKPMLEGVGGRYAVYDVRPAAARLAASLGADAFEAAARAELERPAVEFLDGFLPTADQSANPRRFAAASARMDLVNPSNESRRVRLELVWQAETNDGVTVRAAGPIAGEWWLAGYPLAQNLEFDLPPGRHPVRFQCSPRRPPAGEHPLSPSWRLLLADLTVRP